MGYDTAEEIINSTLLVCGLPTVADPFASQDPAVLQMAGLLTQAGRILVGMYEWQQLNRIHEFNTGATPEIDAPDGVYDLPTDYYGFIDQTGWTPDTVGMGLPLGGPMTEQIYQYLVNTNLASSTIYVSFFVTDGTFKVLPAPAPADLDINFMYRSNGWVQVEGDPDDRTDKVENATDIVMFDPTLISTLLEKLWKEARGFDSTSASSKWDTLMMQQTSNNKPHRILNLAYQPLYPYLNIWTNIPQSGFGSG